MSSSLAVRGNGRTIRRRDANERCAAAMYEAVFGTSLRNEVMFSKNAVPPATFPCFFDEPWEPPLVLPLERSRWFGNDSQGVRRSCTSRAMSLTEGGSRFVDPRMCASTAERGTRTPRKKSQDSASTWTSCRRSLLRAGSLTMRSASQAEKKEANRCHRRR